MAVPRLDAPPVIRVVATVMAVAALIAGYAHLKLYNDGYKDIPAGKVWIVGEIGNQFLLNAIAAAVIAAGILASIVLGVAPRIVALGAALGGVVWGGISMIAFFVARNRTGGWFGFEDQPGLKPSPEAALSVFPEGIVILCGLVLLARLLAASRR